MRSHFLCSNRSIDTSRSTTHHHQQLLTHLQDSKVLIRTHFWNKIQAKEAQIPVEHHRQPRRKMTWIFSENGDTVPEWLYVYGQRQIGGLEQQVRSSSLKHFVEHLPGRLKNTPRCRGHYIYSNDCFKINRANDYTNLEATEWLRWSHQKSNPCNHNDYWAVGPSLKFPNLD